MARKVYRSALQFSREFRRDLHRMGAAAAIALHRVAHRTAKELLLDEVPVTSGDMKASVFSTVGGRPADPSTIRAVEIFSAIGSRDKGWSTVDRGRQRVHYKGFDRLGGSPKAARGMTKPAGEKLTSAGTVARIEREAIAAAEASLV